jgi:hypothetical protein
MVQWRVPGWRVYGIQGRAHHRLEFAVKQKRHGFSLILLFMNLR